MPYSRPTDETLHPAERIWVFAGAVMLSFVAGFCSAD
jgi:hypothetical protein